MLNVAGGMAPEVFFSMTGDAATSISIGTVGSAGVVSNFLTSPTSLSTFNNGEALIQNVRSGRTAGPAQEHACGVLQAASLGHVPA